MATILRSSKYVRNFVELVTKVNFSHIKRNARVSIFSHTDSAHSTLTRYLSTQIASQPLEKESNLEITLQRLDVDVKRYGKISADKLKRMLDTFENSKDVTGTQALMIIRCCGNLVPNELPETKSEFVNRVWKRLEELGIQLDLSHYNALLRVYIENEYSFSPTEILTELERKGIEPNKLTYQRLINRYCQQGDIGGATKILEFMREKGISVNDNIFTALVRGHSEANDMVSAAEILSVMRHAGLEPSADTYKELLCGYAKHGNIDSIKSTLAECETKGVHMLHTDFLDVIFSLASNEHSEHVEFILSIMPKEIGYLQDALNMVAKLVNNDKIDVAMQVLSSIPNREKGNSASATFKHLFNTDLPAEKILEICKEIESRGIDSQVYLRALEVNLLKGNIEGSLKLLENIRDSDVEVREHYFWPLFIALGRSKDDAGIDNLLRTMKIDYNQKISEETLRDYIVPNKTGPPDETFNQLLQAGMSPGSITVKIVYNLILQLKLKEAADFVAQHTFYCSSIIPCRLLVTALANTQDVTSFLKILAHIYKNRFNGRRESNQTPAVENNVLDPYIIEVAEFITDQKSEILIKVLEGLRAIGYRINGTTTLTLEQILGNRITPELRRLLNESRFRTPGIAPNDVNDVANFRAQIAKLEKFVQALNVDDETLVKARKRLLYLYSKIRDLPKLEQLAADLKETGFEFTDSMYRQLLDAYLNSDVLDKTQECLNILKERNPEYELDDHILIKYTILLVQNGRIEDALQFLQDQKGNKLRKRNRSKDIWRKLLNNVANLGNPKAVNAIFDMLIQNEYIEISRSNLAPLIRVHIARNDLAEALNEFERICETYQYTPLKNVLAKELIQAEDATALQRLTDLSTQVHGEANSLYELAQSFIECDCLRQAKKILEISALYSKSQRLVIGSRRYRDRGMKIYLERLVSVIKDLPHFRIIPEFYENLLQCYVWENDWEKALTLKESMESEEIDPSDRFLLTLGGLLKKNNQPVTFPLPVVIGGSNVSEDVQPSGSARISSNRRQSVHRTEDDGKNSGKKIPSKIEEDTLTIESLLHNGQLDPAIEIFESLLEKNLYPLHRTFRFFMRKVCQAGKVEFMEKIAKKLPPSIKQGVNFENNLCQAYITAGRAAEYIDQLEKQFDSNSGSNSASLTEFPMVGVKNILNQKPELVEKCTKMAEKLASQGSMKPINTIWIYHFLNEQPEADKIWSEYLVKYPNVVFHPILHHAQRQNDTEILRRLLKVIDTSELLDVRSKGRVYSELIKLCYLDGNYQESVAVLREALEVVSANNLPPGTLSRMKVFLASKGFSFPADIEQKLITETAEQLTT